MKKKLLYTLLISGFLISCGNKINQTDYKTEIRKFQTELNEGYTNEKTTPLRGDNFKNFKQHPFFPIDSKYRVEARLVKSENSEYFDFPTSSGRTKRYREYGKVYFNLDGKDLSLTLFQMENAGKMKGYENHLFLPFKDLTAGKQTYGGGKYLDLEIPNSNRMIIDFNKSYHPYCAYNAYDYSCPIVPAENSLPVEIKAGVMYEDVYFEH